MKRTAKPRALHHIYRLDYAKTYRAWVVQCRRRDRIVIRRFNDRHYGGKKKALAAAMGFRDTLLGDLQRDAADGLWRRNLKRRTNVSGIVGVGIYVWRHRKNGRLYERTYWQAHWYAEGKHYRRRFSIARYGEKRAKALARRARAAALRGIYGDLYEGE